MAHIGASDDDWSDAKLPSDDDKQDCYHCEGCFIDFSIASIRIRDRDVHCPICLKKLEPHMKGWEPPRC